MNWQGGGKHLHHYPAKVWKLVVEDPDKETANISPIILQKAWEQVVEAQTRRRQTSPPISSKVWKLVVEDPDKEVANISIIIQQPEGW